MYRIVLSLSLLLVPLGLRADTAEDYFHRGAQFYAWGQKQKAKTEILTGLGQYPQDALLNGMAVLLRKEEQQQQQQQQQQSNQPQNQSEQQQQQSQAQQNKSDQNQQTPQQKQQASKPQDQKDKQDQQQASQSAAQQKENSEDKDEQEQAAEAKAAGQMTPEEARQLLDAQKGDEQLLQFREPQKPVDPSHPFRDW